MKLLLKKRLQVLRADIVMTYIFVIFCVAENKLLVFAKKRRGLHLPLVPDKPNIAAIFDYPEKLGTRRVRIEPMKRLRRDDEIDGAGWQCSRFCGTVYAFEIRKFAQDRLRRLPHRRIWLDTVDNIAVFKKKARRYARAGADVGNDGRFGKTHLVLKQLEDR